MKNLRKIVSIESGKASYLVLIITLLIFFSCKKNKSADEKYSSEFNWKSINPNDAGLSPYSLDSLVQKATSGTYGYIDEILLIKDGKIILEESYSLDYITISQGKKGKMGCGINMCLDSSAIHPYNYYHPKYHPYFQETKLHTLQSITKSITSMLIGIAISEGKIKSVDEKIYPYFKQYAIKDAETITHLKNTTLKDLLTMQLGLKWIESGQTLEMENDASNMEKSNDWIAYVLNQEVTADPGTVWNYSSGVSQLLSQIMKEATGMTIDQYAEKTLFNKLGINDYHWKKTPNGLPDTESGLYLGIRDLGKIGLLMLQKGLWNDELILQDQWISEAITKHVQDIYGDGGKEGYGYQWWLTGNVENPKIVGLGYGNQILLILPRQNIVGIVFAWNVFDNQGQYIFGDLNKVLLSNKDK